MDDAPTTTRIDAPIPMRLGGVPPELAQELLDDLAAILAHGFGDLRVEVENGRADILPARRKRYRIPTPASEQVTT